MMMRHRQDTEVNPTCASAVKKVLARADPARGEHAEPAPGQWGRTKPFLAASKRHPAQVVISSGMLCIGLGEEKKVTCSS